MSTSKGDPSRKMGWFRSMCDKIDHENNLVDKEKKKNASNNPKRARADKPEDKPAAEPTQG